MTFEELKNKALSLPQSPGVYQFIDKEGTIIYVGKAKNLKNRVSSYFNKNIDSAKTRILVRHIHDIRHIVVDTETDALLLENTLIKQYQPKYNIQLKDDKTYPWIVIKNEPFPRVFYTRTIIKDGSEYFGPYTSVNLVRTIISMFKEVFKIRTCNLNLSQENIAKGKFKPCLEYHIKNCLGPCIGQQSKDDYDRNIEQIKKILRGKTFVVIEHLKKQMLFHAGKLEFEKAEEIKRSIELLQNYQSRSTVVSPSLGDIEIFTILDDIKYAYVNFLKVVDGSIIQTFSTEIKKKLDETPGEILAQAIVDIRENKVHGVSNAKEILVPFEIDMQLPGVKIRVPKIGEKKKLLELSLKNLKYYKLEKEKNRLNTDPNYKALKNLEQMKKDLNLQNIPVHIECFDNSNLQGTNAVAACVVFKYGKPSKKDYRKFNIKTVEGPDDFASMREIIYRRYKRLLDEKQPLPDLIIIDGGKGQLSAALESLQKLGIENKVEIISIAKRLEEIFKPNDPYPMYVDKNSYTLKIIQHARDEAHRFGITFHREKRQKSMFDNDLKNVKGVGEKTYEKLVKHFGSLKKVSQASFEELSKIVGKSKAKIIFDFYHSDKKD